MNRLRISSIVAAAALISTPGLADSITGTTTGGGNTITGPTITSTNSGTISATGSFDRRSIILGGRSNLIGVAAIGAGVNIQILKEGGDPNAPTNDSIVVGSITATNTSTGTVTSTGTFNGNIIRGGTGNGMSVSAAGTSVSLSIVKR